MYPQNDTSTRSRQRTRLLFIRRNQNVLRAEKYVNIKDAVTISESHSNLAGRRIILPSTFPGSPRYMTEIYHDAMGICKTYGFPDVFITFTCNPKWPEIKRFVHSRGIRSEDRPDILSPVFRLKLDSLISDLKKENIFGRVNACTYFSLLIIFIIYNSDLNINMLLIINYIYVYL